MISFSPTCASGTPSAKRNTRASCCNRRTVATLADWYQEALDGAVYARQAVHEYMARDMRIPGANHDLVRIRQAYQKQIALVFTIREMIADRDEAQAAKSAT